MFPTLSLAGTVFLQEAKSAIRDRNTVIYSVVLPLFLYPALVWSVVQWIQFQEGSLERQVSRVAWDGAETAPTFAERIRSDTRIEVVPSSSPTEDVERGELDAYLRFSVPASGVPVMEAHFDLSRDRSATTQERLRACAAEYCDSVVAARLRAYGESEESAEIIRVTEENIASAEEMGRFMMSMVLPMLLVFMLTLGALHPAVDALVGERERKTVESLLASGAPRLSILTGKFLVVVAAALSALILNLTGMLFALNHMLRLVHDSRQIQIALPWSAVPVVLLAGLLLAAFIGATMIFLVSFARTFKEGQSYLTPFCLICFIPAIAASVPGMELRVATALLPITNVTLLFRDAMTGSYRPLPVLLVFFSMSVWAAGALWVAHKVYCDEDVLLGGGHRSLRSLPGILSARRGS